MAIAKSKFEGWLYVILAIIIAVRFFGAYQEVKLRRSAVLEPTTAPNFLWRDFDGEKHMLKDLAGKTVILHFWATWCGPCREEFPSLLQAAQAMGKDVVILTISGDEDDALAKKFILAAKGAAGVRPDNVLYGFDPMKSVIMDTFQTAAFPETFIIDQQLNLRRKLAGKQDWTDPQLMNYIHDLKPSISANIIPKAP